MNGLELGQAAALEPTGSLFVPAGSLETRTLRLTDSYLFVFVARGDIAVA